MSQKPPSDLYKRYMAAYAAEQAHARDCADCASGERCVAGRRLYERFARLQDAYLQFLFRRLGL